MTGISLHRLNVAAIQLQLIGDAGMAQAVKNYSRKVVLLNKFRKSSVIRVCSVGIPKPFARTKL